MVLGQVKVAEHEKNILRAPLCIIQATITPEAAQYPPREVILGLSQEPKITSLGGYYVTSRVIVARKTQNNTPKIFFFVFSDLNFT